MSDHEPDRAESRYPQVVRAVAETPWAILPSKLAAIVELVAARADGHRLTEEEIQARIGAGPGRRDLVMAGNVAVIPIYGVITPRADMFTAMSGGTSVQRLQATLRDAVDDQKVRSIVLDIDSPGGQVDLIPELAAEIRAARGKKPVVAVANTTAASAAYWLGAQASEFVVTPSGEVGSIGVFAAHDDISGMQERLGVKTTLISAGKFKTETSPFGPLSDEAREAIQARVDDSYRMFVVDVAKGRGVPGSKVRSGFGEGRILVATAALKEGMVDRIGTLDETVARLSRGRHAPAPAEPDTDPLGDLIDDEAAETGLTFADEATVARDAADALVERLASLAEVDRGRLTAAKRDALSACPEAFRAAAQHIEDVLAATDPNKDTEELWQIAARFERSTANL